MVQGPISRFGDLGPQLLAGRSLDFGNLKYGIQLMLWGYFKKLVIADRAAVLVSSVLDHPWDHSGSILAVGVLFYCIQLYGDFSGGIDITRGVAKLFGIDLAENFRRPLYATSLTDFWRRWHITLGTWMRDYLFYPLSLSKPFGKLGKLTRRHIKGKLGKILPTSLATFLVYLVIGIWHGANWRYIAFGFWNGGIITLSLLLSPASTGGSSPCTSTIRPGAGTSSGWSGPMSSSSSAATSPAPRAFSRRSGWPKRRCSTLSLPTLPTARCSPWA